MPDQNAQLSTEMQEALQTAVESAQEGKKEAVKQLSSVEEQLKKLEEGFAKEQEKARLDQIEGRINEVRSEVEKTLADFDTRMQRVVDGVNAQAHKLMNQILAVEQSVLSFGKILTSTVKALTEKGLITDEEVMSQLRKGEDKLEEDQLAELVQLGILELAQTSDESSILVVKQEEIFPDGSSKLVANYRRVEIPTMKQDDPLRAQFIGKTAGDVVAVAGGDQAFSFTVMAVYKIADQGKLTPPNKG